VAVVVNGRSVVLVCRVRGEQRRLCKWYRWHCGQDTQVFGWLRRLFSATAAQHATDWRSSAEERRGSTSYHLSQTVRC